MAKHPEIIVRLSGSGNDFSILADVGKRFAQSWGAGRGNRQVMRRGVVGG
jgi:hypothetical protein